ETVGKPIDSYTRTTPAHVKAARKQGAGAGRVVTYVVTRAGPEPVGHMTAPPDREHYVTQQLKPPADAILRFVPRPDFDDLSVAGRQLSLSWRTAGARRRLTLRLAELRERGLVEIDPEGGYRLASAGRGLLRALAPLQAWATRWARDR